jgi:K+-sensing histidine kinase KdpD
MISSAKSLHAQMMGISKIQLTEIQLSSLVFETIDLISEHSESKRIKIDTQSLLHNHKVLADPSTLKNNVILNALTNAIKFSPTDATLKIYSESNNNITKLIIEDEGPGFSPSQLINIKDSIPTPTTPGTLGERGTGLGILQMQGFMESYGGDLIIENVATKGCRIILKFKSPKSS